MGLRRYMVKGYKITANIEENDVAKQRKCQTNSVLQFIMFGRVKLI